MDYNYPRLKENEYLFQNEKYALTPLDVQAHVTSEASFERKYLTPKHEGGHDRGYLFREAIAKMFSANLSGTCILDYCCGRGDLAIYLRTKFADAEVYGFDFSDAAIKIASVKNRANNLNVRFDVMDAEQLTYSDESFDYIVGFEALHHVLVHPGVPREIARVIKKNGKVIFAENYGNNPIFELYRKLNTLRKNRSHERGEMILNSAMVEKRFLIYFSTIEIFPLSFLYMAKHKIHSQSLLKRIFVLDRMLLSRFPSLREMCGESVIVLRNKV